jgi:chromate transporter
MISLLEIFYISLKLGLTSFGGPIAHLGYFHNEYVLQRKWLDEKTYADLVSLCQFLPGPASSQIIYSIGVIRGGLVGGILSSIGFTLPSSIFLILFAFFIHKFDISNSGLFHGLKIVAVSIVAQAILTMGKRFSSEKITITIACISTIISLLWNFPLSQILIILFSGIIGLFIFSNSKISDYKENNVYINHTFAKICLLIVLLLLIILPIFRVIYPNTSFLLIDSFYRSGSLVFGGGHVILPLLEKEFVSTGYITKDQFLAGYGLVQAVPGPLFTFSSYIGAVIYGWKGAFISTISIFLPSILLVTGALPFWDNLRKIKKVQSALIGVNAGVVGILISAFYNPIWTSSINNSLDFCFAFIFFILIEFWKVPPVFIVILGALLGYFFTF